MRETPLPLYASSALALALALISLSAPAGARAEPLEGIHKIQHVIVIMQENRSFDSYFGTFPGADGIPAGVCIPDPLKGGCVAPYHNPNLKGNGGPHGTSAAEADIDGGKMDGFIKVAENGKNCTTLNAECSGCGTAERPECSEVVGYHDARELPNYWEYAKNFVLQDRMFEASRTASLHSHGYLVSAWWAHCPEGDTNPFDCVETKNPEVSSTTRAWTDVTYLLAGAHVSWRYYVKEGTEPDCESDEAVTCAPVRQGPKTPSIFNPLPAFTDVSEDGQLEDIQSLNGFYSAVHEPSSCGLPNVSWIAPSDDVSEHPPAALPAGQTYVTTLINSVMRSPCWNSTAIFVSWDDWGGFYDHVVPPRIDPSGYGLRVPAFLVSPYARAGYVDHRQLSFDAYLKFIEDDFLGGARLNPATDGRPDRRPDVREEAPGLADLAGDFNFAQSPRAPLVLSAHPEPGPASHEPGSAQPPALETAPAAEVGTTAALLNGTVNPDGTAVSDCHFDYGLTTSYGASIPCSSSPGAGSAPVSVSARLERLAPTTTYHFRIVAAGAGGAGVGPDLQFTTAQPGPAAETGIASSVRQTAATLNATVNPEGSAVSACRFEYGPTTAYAASAPCSPSPGSGTSPVEVSARLEGLGANTGYHFRVVATNAGGTSVGADATFATLPEAPSLAAAAASDVAQAGARLHATVDPNGGEVSDCRFEYGPTAAYGASAPCSPSAGSGTSPVEVSAQLGGLAPNTGYHFRVVATNAGGTSTGSDQSFATLPEAPALSNASASAVTQSTAALAATVNPNGGAVSDCRFEYGPTASYGTSAPCSPSPGSGTSPVEVGAQLEGLSPNRTYHFRVVATNAGGTSFGADATLATLPEAPTLTGVSASEVSQTTANLHAGVDPHGGTVSDCRFEYGPTASYGTSAPCSPSPGSGTSPVEVGAQLEGLSPNRTYHFRIVATNAGGTSFGADATLATLPEAPGVQTGSASERTPQSAVIHALVSPNGASVGDCHFDYGTSVFYESTEPCSPVPGSGTSPVEVSARLEGLTPSTSYHFRVVATNAGGTSFGEDAAFATLQLPPSVGSLSPVAGPEAGATTVLLSGANLTGVSAVAFGSTGATSFIVNSDTSITATSPRGSGTVDVRVTTPGGTSAVTSADRFAYVAPPVVTKVSPVSGGAEGGTAVTITGTSLSGASAVTFGATAASAYTVVSPISIRATAPAGTPGTVDVRVTTAGGTSAVVSADHFKYTPTISALSPTSGPTAGGTTVTVTGAGFVPGSSGTTFKFGATKAASVSCSSSSVCTVTSPAHAAGVVDVKAVVHGVASPKVAADRFTFQ